ALEMAQKGEILLYTGDGYTKTMVPVRIGDSGVFWDIIVTVPEGVIGTEPFSQILTLLIIGIILAIFGVFLLYLVARSIARPIVTVTAMADRFAEGEISTNLIVDQEDEIGQLAKSFKRLGESLKGKEEASASIAKGEFRIMIPLASDRDVLGTAMIQMKEAIIGLVTSADQIATAAEAGDLKQRGDPNQFKGDYRSIITGLNNTLDSIVTPVSEAMRLSGSYAKGDYTDRIDEKLVVKGDFIAFKDALNQIGIQGSSAIGEVKEEVESLSAGMEETNASVEEVSSTTTLLSRGASSVSDLAERSGSGIQQTLTAMEDLSSTVSAVAMKAEQASSMAKETVDLSERGVILAGKAEKGMDGIMHSVDETSSIITDITSQMEEIGNIVGVISGIADQTGLLALNAAIEAARAGDAGLGFAVVADEVKTLALESQKSAENIAMIIGNLQNQSHLVSESMKTSAIEVKTGNAAVSETLSVFNQIVQAINVVHDNMIEVAGATEEQEAAVDEITASVHELGTLVQQTAKEAIDSEAATEEVSASIDQITKAISDASASIQNIASEMDRFTTS
ncbi:MAG: methyl-accepting chemotaxis protein, partial [Methanobacteriota archaeon]